jgi:hypothetical protein
MFAGVSDLDPTTSPQTRSPCSSPKYATLWEFYFYLSQIRTKPQAHKTTAQLSSLYATHWKLYFCLSQIGTKPQAHKTKFKKTFLHVFQIWTVPQAHTPTAQISFQCYALKVLFLPLSDLDQTTSPQNQVKKLFCRCVLFVPYHKPTHPQPAFLPTLHIERFFSTSLRLGPNHKPTKPS